jgi:alpha-D-ribose 1-methylphosphonate 5-triphosphate synthase subunit PhnG
MSAVINKAGHPDRSAGGKRSFARPAWLAVLAKARVEELQAAWGELADKPTYRMLRPAETGLIMVRGRIGGTGQPFNFGEVTMTRAAIQLIDTMGRVSYTGFGHVAGRSARHAELVALFDALLQDPGRHKALTATLVVPLTARQHAAKAANAAKAMSSKVNFYTMVRGE